MNILKINGQALEGIYVDAAISFNKPAKRVSTYSVPGRNGDLVIDEGTFDNVLITYPVFEKSTFPTEFDAIVNYLASLEGYQRIECSNDPQHYRLGRFVVPTNPTAKRLNRDGYWQLSFDCKPQRWLLSGEEDTEIDANPIDEYSGDIVSFDAVALDEITELKAAIEPVQSGSGDPSPTNVRPISGHTDAVVSRTGVNVWDEEWEVGAYNSSGAKSTAATSIRNVNHIRVLPNTDYYFCVPTQVTNIRKVWRDANGGFISYANNRNLSVTSPSEAYYLDVAFMDNGATYNHDISINYPSTDHDYHASQVAQYPISLGQTVYGGTLNVTTGVLTIDRGFATFDGSSDESWTVGSANAAIDISDMPSGSKMSGLSNMYVVGSSAGQLRLGNNNKKLYLVSIVSTQGITTLAQLQTFLSGNPLQVVYPLATPTTVQLTAAEVELLLGQNNIWADTGDVEVKVTTPTVFNNPSPFNSKPLIRVYGIGTFRVNDITVTIASHDKPYIDIDCELQECYYGSENMNEYVSFSGNDFPELQPGDNYMLLVSGITKLDVTPRWWIL